MISKSLIERSRSVLNDTTVLGDLTFASGKGINFDAYGIKITDTYIQFGDDATALGPKLMWESHAAPGAIQLRNAANSEYATLKLYRCQANSSISAPIISISSASGSFNTNNGDASYATFMARDTGVGLVEIGRLTGAADPYFSMGGSQQFKFYHSGVANFGGNVTLGNLLFAEDGGAKSLIDMAVSATPADGTEESIDLKLDGVSMFKLFGKADGAGAVDERSLICGTYLQLYQTDTDGVVEGQVWYDASENKLKFYNGTAVETITSAA